MGAGMRDRKVSMWEETRHRERGGGEGHVQTRFLPRREQRAETGDSRERLLLNRERRERGKERERETRKIEGD
jgi:hypothetical protein